MMGKDLATFSTCGNDSVYHRPVEKITAFVLAGGKSLRMGRDKAFLEFGERTLLERALAVAGGNGREVHILGDPAQFARFGPTVQDIFRGCGPLGGIHAALRSSMTKWNLMLAVDMPFVSDAFLTWLTKEAIRCGTKVTAPRTSRGYEPLCAVYRRDFVVCAEQALRAGNNRIDVLFEAEQSRIIEPAELAELGFAQDIFRNLNTPEEWQHALGNLKQ